MAQQAFRFSSADGGNGTFTVSTSGAIVGASLDAGSGLIVTTGNLNADDGIFTGDIQAGDITATGSMAGASFSTGGVITGGSITDGTATLTSGALSGATTIDASGAITGGSLTDGVATISAGAISGATTIDASAAITGGSLTDGTATLTSGALSGATTIDASGLITGGSLTDGTATLSSGSLAGAADIDGSGDLTMGTITMTGFSVASNGVMAALTGSSVGNLTLADGSITDSGGSISFGSDDLSTTGTLDAGAATVTSLDAGSGSIQTTGTADLGDTTVDSLDASSGGITNAGAVSGVTTLAMSDVLTIGDVVGGTSYTFPTLRGTANQILKLDGSGNLTFQDDGGAAGPGGASGNIQFNDGSGGFAGDASLNWDTTNDILELGNAGSIYAGLASNTQLVAGGASAFSIDTFSQTNYVAAKYLITAETTAAGNYIHTIELLISADGATTNFVPFADVFTSSPLFTVDVTGTSTVSVNVTNLDGGNDINVQFMRTTLA